jgi:hypothetical protein
MIRRILSESELQHRHTKPGRLRAAYILPTLNGLKAGKGANIKKKYINLLNHIRAIEEHILRD